jgi:hypothetical protein
MPERRKTQKNERSDQVRASRRRRAKDILSSIGLYSHLQGTNAEERFLSAYYPRIELKGKENLPFESGARILREMDKALRKATVTVPLLGEVLCVEYFSIVKPILDLFQEVTSRNAATNAAFMAIKERTTTLASAETAGQALGELNRALDNVLIRYGRIDSQLYFVKSHLGRTEAGKWFVKFVVHRAIPETREVQTGKGPRVGYRCGRPYVDEIEWVAWPASVMGIKGDDVYPVFVQGHALDNLYRVERRALFIEDGEWLVHDYLWQSLREPKIHKHPKEQDAFFVEYWLNMHKIGYLIARRGDNAVMVHTFLFLTMDGTPEGDTLLEKLRLLKKDKKETGLDRIQTFMVTDLQFDPELVALLNDCGCGHLFKIMKEMPRERYVTGYAEKFRQYLKSMK